MNSEIDLHIIESVRDEKKFRVIVSKAPSGARWQWAVGFGVNVDNILGQTMPVNQLNQLLYDLVELGE